MTITDNEKRGMLAAVAERVRQIQEEGWSSSHDDGHTEYELTSAAVTYAEEATREGLLASPDAPPSWPWENESWKPACVGSIAINDSKRLLGKAAALLIAEWDRLDRIQREVADLRGR